MMKISNSNSIEPKVMKIKFLSLVAGVSALILSFSPMAASARGFRNGFSELNLTPQQQAQIEQIRENAKSQMQNILTPEQRQQFETMRQQGQQVGKGRQRGQGMGRMNLSVEQREQMRSLRDSTHQQISNVLTPEQQEQLRQKIEARRGQGGFGPRN
jgi:Spy/CpxP family protein refolding chaperone